MFGKRKKLSRAENYDLTLNKIRYNTYFYIEQLFLCPLTIYIITVIFLDEIVAVHYYYSYHERVIYINKLLYDSFMWIFVAIIEFVIKLIHANVFGTHAHAWLVKQLSLSHTTYQQTIITFQKHLKQMFAHWQIHVSLILSSIYVASSIVMSFLNNHEKEEVLRGTTIKDVGKVKNIYKYIRDNENKHTFVIGTTGAGKTQTFLNIMKHAFTYDKRHNNYVKNIIFDAKGDFLCRFYNDREDAIINIFDQRTLRWDFLKDTETLADVDELASAFVYSNAQQITRTGTDEFFSSRAKQFMRDVFILLKQHNFTQTQVVATCILELLEKQDKIKLDPVCPFLYKIIEKYKATSSDRSYADLIATVSNAVDFLRYIKFMSNNDDFVIKDYLHTANYRNIYITLSAQHRSACEQFNSVFLRMLLLKLMSLNDVNYVRFRIFIDEFSMFSRIPDIADALNFLRSRGVALYLSTQSFSKLRSSYTQEEISSIINACNNIVIFKLIDTYSAKTASELIGQRQVLRADKNQFSTPGDSSIDGFSLQQHTITENALLDSEIRDLKPLSFYAYLRNEWVKGILKLTKLQQKQNCKFFIDRRDFFIFDDEDKEDDSKKDTKQRSIEEQAQEQETQQTQDEQKEQKEQEQNVEDIDIFNLR